MLRRICCPEVGIFFAIWLALMLPGRTMLLRDPGTLWHTVVGDEILRTGELVRADPFSFTAADRPWVAQWWLAECGMAALHGALGLDGLLLLTAAILAATYTCIVSRLIRAGLHTLPAVLLIGLVLAASSHNFHARPLIVTIALLAWTFALLVDVEAGRLPLRRLWWLVPVFVLWTNMHGGVLGGLGTLGLVGGGWCLVWLLRGDSPLHGRREMLALAALVLVCCLSVLINPYGPDLPRAWLNTLALPLSELIEEHAPLDLSKPPGWTVVLLGVGYVVLLAGVFPKRPRVTWLLPLVWFILACQRVRHAPLFAITAAIASADMLPHTRWAAWLARREMFRLPEAEKGTRFNLPERPGGCFAQIKPGPFFGSVSRPRGWIILPLVLIGVTMLIEASGARVPVVGRGWARLDSAYWPVELLPELEKINRESPDGTRIFNDLGLGGFLIYHTPRLRVFIDDRCALYGHDLLPAYDHARRENPARIDRWHDQYGFPYALVVTGSPFDRYLDQSDAWVPIRRAPAATLYRRSAAR